MTTLTMPSLERRLLQTVAEEIAAGSVHQWPRPSLQLCLDVLRKIREHAADARQALGGVLADGVEARAFARDYSPSLPLADDHIAKVRGLMERLSPAEDAASGSLAAEL